MSQRRLLVALALALAATTAPGCGAAEKTTTFAPPLADDTHATLAGHRCGRGTYCQCRDPGDAADQAEKSPVEDGQKRFEVRIASVTGQVWVTIDGKDQLYKGKERGEDCFYLDLPAGSKHTVAVRAKALRPEGGVGAGLRVSEHFAHETGSYWYRTFAFQCGIPGPCDQDALDAWKAALATDRSGMHDVCGTTRVTGLSWQTGRMPDSVHPEEVSFGFTLDVMKRAPEHPPESEVCPKI